ncbi:DUF1223 domain-containing protein [Mesobacterium pallidum]|uniref:DUF1223 domain-containing protein n=1 Tax=Mesobacterium pallidum TaxID=2872037 RepID=UPI001EE1720E|nr:DUF1223 domain-containing protein [Mesobacterium pallidum]
MHMRSRIGAVAGLALALAGAIVGGAGATERGVVVELYTSQGCSSCPPADELLARLSEKDGVIPLALHVDYWDYIGWTDIFGDPRFTKRQKKYAHVAGRRMIYTPQMIVSGTDHVVGTHPMDLADLIDMHEERPVPVSLELTRDGDALTITLETVAPLGPTMVQLVRYLPSKEVKIKRGENAGKTLTYTNIVTDWQALGDWDGEGRDAIEAQVTGDLPIVVIVQKPGPGEIVAAGRLR